MNIINDIQKLLWSGDISGSASSVIAVVAMEDSVLTPLLPDGLKLATQLLTEPGLHPVYFAFNFKQINVTTPLPFFKLNYAEFAMGIPYLQLQNSAITNNFAFSPVLYLNSLPATLGGRFFFSLPKNFSHIQIAQNKKKNESSFLASHYFNHNETYLQGIFNQDGPAIKGHSLKNFVDIMPLLKQPLIVYDVLNGFRYTDYDMEGLDTCYIQPMTGSCKTDDFITGIQHKNMALQSINNSVLGTFKIDYNWKLSKATPVK